MAIKIYSLAQWYKCDGVDLPWNMGSAVPHAIAWCFIYQADRDLAGELVKNCINRNISTVSFPPITLRQAFTSYMHKELFTSRRVELVWNCITQERMNADMVTCSLSCWGRDVWCLSWEAALQALWCLSVQDLYRGQSYFLSLQHLSQARPLALPTAIYSVTFSPTTHSSPKTHTADAVLEVSRCYPQTLEWSHSSPML